MQNLGNPSAVRSICRRHKIVPCWPGELNTGRSWLFKVLLGGDQLTAARARGAAALRDGHNTSHDRLEGFEAVIEDWHARLAFDKVLKVHYISRGCY